MKATCSFADAALAQKHVQCAGETGLLRRHELADRLSQSGLLAGVD